MTERLPRGLVKTNDALEHEIARLDQARDSELHQLWKGHFSIMAEYGQSC